MGAPHIRITGTLFVIINNPRQDAVAWGDTFEGIESYIYTQIRIPNNGYALISTPYIDKSSDYLDPHSKKYILTRLSLGKWDSVSCAVESRSSLLFLNTKKELGEISIRFIVG